MTFKKYGEHEVSTLLESIDKHLKRRAEMILIGGTAAILAYKVAHATQDIDTYNNIDAILYAYEAAKKETGLDIPLSQAAVADLPINFEDRLFLYKNKKFKNLLVKIPEVHDFILSKVVRGYEHDMETIREVINNNKVDMQILKKRFENEMDHVIGDKKRIELNFLLMLELFQ